jgi:hypothetical protein
MRPAARRYRSTRNQAASPTDAPGTLSKSGIFAFNLVKITYNRLEQWSLSDT